jgi:hypothetical protein
MRRREEGPSSALRGNPPEEPSERQADPAARIKGGRSRHPASRLQHGNRGGRAQDGGSQEDQFNKIMHFVKYCGKRASIGQISRLLPESQTPEISVNVQEDRCHAVAATTAPFRRRMAVDFARRGRSPGRPGKQP